MRYGAQYKLWTPLSHLSFPKRFRRLVRLVMMCYNNNYSAFAQYRIPLDAVMHILNMCRWDWAGALEDDEAKEGRYKLEDSYKARIERRIYNGQMYH